MVEHTHDEHEMGAGKPPGGNRASRWVFWAFALIAAYFLWTEHRAHVVQYLPFLLILACPLLHMFHGHAGHGEHDGQDENKKGPRK